jgi:hypothetical protein
MLNVAAARTLPNQTVKAILRLNGSASLASWRPGDEPKSSPGACPA